MTQDSWSSKTRSTEKPAGFSVIIRETLRSAVFSRGTGNVAAKISTTPRLIRRMMLKPKCLMMKSTETK